VGRDYNHTHAAFVGNTLYVIGGFDVMVGLETSIVYRASFEDGRLGAWSTTTALPAERALGDVVVLDDRVYVVGGANFGAAQSSVYYADDAATGDITRWSAASSLPVAIKAHAAAAANGYLYAFGGGDLTNVRQAAVYVAAVQANGGLGTWQASTPLPAVRANFSGVAARGFLYAIGGDDAQEQATDTVFVAALDPTTGAVGTWSETTRLPAARKGLVAVTDGNHVYVIGGQGSGAPSSEVLHSRIGDDGALGPWEPNEPLLMPRMRHAAVLANGNAFVLGGATSATSVEQSTQLVP